MKTYRRILPLLLLSVGLFGLVSCGDEKPSSSTGESEEQSYEELDQNKRYFDITSSLKLEKDYVGKDFKEDGIGEAELLRVRDGDTAEFRLKESNEKVVIRYYCIDTPESTGKIEKWGKSASLFAKSILENAEEFVLEASHTPARVDSYGSRYLGYVWYKMDQDSDWMNMNLLMIENGYTRNVSVPGSIDYPYHDTFQRAEDFASNGQLHIHGNANDPYYSTNAIEVTVKDLVTNPYDYYNVEQDNGSKVEFDAYLSDLEIYDDQYHFTASAVFDGQIYDMPIYAGYGHTQAAINLMVGTKYHIVGYLQKHAGSFQISGLKVSSFSTSKDNTESIIDDYFLDFGSDTEYKAYFGDSLFTSATISAAVIDGDNIKLTASANSKKDEAAHNFTILVPNTNLDDSQVNGLVGKQANFKGYQEEKGIVNVIKYSDIEFK